MPESPETSQPHGALASSAPTRRATLRGLGLAGMGLLASACSVQVRNPWSAQSPHAAPHPRPSASPGVDHDLDLAAQALGLVETTLHLVERTGRRHHDLRSGYADLRAMHRAHQQALVDAVPADQRVRRAPRPVRVPRDAGRARRAVTAAETSLRTGLTALAQRAASGDLARLLASMSAAVAQQQAANGHLSGMGPG